ncbi:class I adenylate-forming enzyme family protein [uncultured Jatrophihabitans sp.]|uniref:class I adenylate-forming enzyme family protein n=1 Tax=uncultured Jatrophihabitans sp. TaxID=1610747 RepID=UPI0035CC4CB2
MTPETRPRPWRKLYPPGVDPELAAPSRTVLDSFLDTVAADPDAAAVHYFGATLTRAEVAEHSGRLAAVLRDAGVVRGDRIAVSLQNTPIMAVALLAAWSAGASVVPINPMLRPDELAPMLADCGAVVLIAHPAMREVVESTRIRLERPPITLWSDPADLAGDSPTLPFPVDVRLPPGERTVLAECAAARVEDGRPRPGADDTALITYTSGTTGPAKGAMSSHANLAYQMENARQWFGCDASTSVLTVAPLFHITGLGLHAALALGNGYPLVMTYRFEPRTVLQLIERYEPTFTIGAITAFISLLESGPDTGRTLGKLQILYSGGAPVPAQVVERFERATGRYIHNIYGLTETSSACIGVPLGARAPIEQRSGALSIGVPMGGTTVTVVDDAGQPVPSGGEGEIVVAGPQVDLGYWRKPGETAAAFRPDGMHTGDIGVMDADGWVYVVDRKKDLVVVSGYKVWPRDVEDVLYRHPAVKEAAVVGRPDGYRGETLHAYVSVRAGEAVTAADLRAHCREHLSAYKVPAEYYFVDELPKTITGKILRRTLRDAPTPTTQSAR